MPLQRTASRLLVPVALIGWMLSIGHSKAEGQRNGSQKPTSAETSSAVEYSGMYGFLREGEFVQVTVEGQGRVTGFVSRYGDSESDRGDFLDHFFKSGRLSGDQLTFITETVHGVSFEFKGTIERGAGKNRGDEAYYVLNGTLIENITDEAKKTSSRSRDVALKAFPQDMSPSGSEKR